MKLILSKKIDLIHLFLVKCIQVNFASLGFFQKLIQRQRIRSRSETIFDINFVEEGNHVLSLVFGVIEMFYSIKNNDHNDLMRTNSSFLQKLFIALLDAFNCRFKHMFLLAEYANANGHLDSSFPCSSKERYKAIAGQLI